MSEEAKVVSIHTTTQASIVELLRDALRQAEAGDVTGVLVVMTTRTKPNTVTTLKQTEDCMRMIGALKIAADDMSDWMRE